MNRVFCILALCLVLVLSVSANTIFYDVPFSSDVNVAQNFDLNVVLPAGTINSVTVELLAGSSLTSSGSIQNLTTGNATLTFYLTGFEFVLSVPGFTPATYDGTDRDELNSSQDVGPNGPGDTATYALITDPVSDVLGTLTSGDCLDGVCTFTVDKNGQASAESSAGSVAATLLSSVQGTVRFTFDYTPDTNPVPEPSAIFLVGSALIGLGVLGRRRIRG